MTTPPVTDKADRTETADEMMDRTTTMEFSGVELGMILNSLSVAVGVLQRQDIGYAALAALGTAMKLGPARTQALLDKIRDRLNESFTDPAKGVRTVSENDAPAVMGDIVARAVERVVSEAAQATAQAAMQPPINKEVA